MLYKKVSTWRDLSKTDALLRKCHRISTPNLSIVAKVLDDHKAFQEAQVDETETAELKQKLLEQIREKERSLIEKKYRNEYMDRLRKDEE